MKNCKGGKERIHLWYRAESKPQTKACNEICALSFSPFHPEVCLRGIAWAQEAVIAPRRKQMHPVTAWTLIWICTLSLFANGLKAGCGFSPFSWRHVVSTYRGGRSNLNGVEWLLIQHIFTLSARYRLHMHMPEKPTNWNVCTDAYAKQRASLPVDFWGTWGESWFVSATTPATHEDHHRSPPPLGWLLDSLKRGWNFNLELHQWLYTHMLLF